MAISFQVDWKFLCCFNAAFKIHNNVDELGCWVRIPMNMVYSNPPTQQPCHSPMLPQSTIPVSIQPRQGVTVWSILNCHAGLLQLGLIKQSSTLDFCLSLFTKKHCPSRIREKTYLNPDVNNPDIEQYSLPVLHEYSWSKIARYHYQWYNGVSRERELAYVNIGA